VKEGEERERVRERMRLEREGEVKVGGERERERVKRERERGEKEEKDEKDAPFFLFQSSTLFFSAFEPSPPLSVSLSLRCSPLCIHSAAKRRPR